MTTIKKNKSDNSQLATFLRKFKANKAAVAGFTCFCLFLAVLCICSIVLDYQEDAIRQDMTIRKLPPSWEYPCGTDGYGRNLFARIVYGGWISIAIAASTVLIFSVFGTLLGTVAGFFGGIVDSVLMRFSDIFMSIPPILMAITIAAALGGGAVNLVLALSVTSVPGFARVVRSAVMSIRNQEYVEAARACGVKNHVTIIKHIIPNVIGPIIVQMTQGLSRTILSVSGLSFLGLGVASPTPEWGTLLSEGKEFIRTCPYMLVFPGIAIIILCLSLNLTGEGLRDALDPRQVDRRKRKIRSSHGSK
ncbi:MAG: ABC transporter permease [Oscillospiraceae bacterium]